MIKFFLSLPYPQENYSNAYACFCDKLAKMSMNGLAKEGFTPQKIAQMIDLSAVRTENDDQSILKLVECAHCYQIGLVTTLPTQTSLARRLLGQPSPIKLRGNVGFPSGGQTKFTKLQETRELLKLACDEFDVVMNLSALISGRVSDVREELSAVVQIAGKCPVKVILECHYLSPEQIRKGFDLAGKLQNL